MTGNSTYGQLSLVPRFLIDDNLSPPLAPALRGISPHDVLNVREVFPELDPRTNPALDDQHIIPWLAAQGQRAVWVTADENALKEHSKLILAANVSMLIVHRPKAGMSAMQEMYVLAGVLNTTAQVVTSAVRPVYLRASLRLHKVILEDAASLSGNPKLRWKKIQLTRV